MKKIWLIFNILECLFDILSSMFMNVRVILDKYKEYKDWVKEDE